MEKSVRYYSKKLVNKDTANIVENKIKYLFEKPNLVELDIINAAQNDHFKNLNWVNDKMMFKPQNMILNTEDYDYIDSFTPYVYKADIKNRTYTNSPTWDNQYFFYLDEYHKFMLYSYLNTVGGRNFKKFITPLLKDYFPDQSIQNIYNAARQYICRNKENVKTFTEMEKLCFEFEFKDLIENYGIVWDKNEQIKAKESLIVNTVTNVEEEDLNESNPLTNSENCDINVKEREENNFIKENNILYNNIPYTPMSQNELPEIIEPTDLSFSQKLKEIESKPDFWEQLEKLVDSLPVHHIEKSPEELEKERLEQEQRDRFFEELSKL